MFSPNIPKTSWLRAGIYLIGDVIDDKISDEELKIRFHISNTYLESQNE